MDNISSKSDDQSTDALIHIPGKVYGGLEDLNEESQPKNGTSLMTRVSPEQDRLSSSSRTSLRQRVVTEQAAESNEAMMTSFTNSDVDLYGDNNLAYQESVMNDKPHRLSTGPTRIDSMQAASDARLDNIDVTEQSLHQIARDGDVMLMKAVLNKLSPSRAVRKLNKKDSDKFTPLHYAARYNHFEMCKLLLQRGANLHAPGDDAITALQLVAKYKPRKDKVFGAGDGDKSDVSSEDDNIAQQEANIKVLEFLIASGAHVNAKDFYGLTALHHASLRGNEACVQKLLECRGIAIESTDKQQMTPLHVCAVYGHVNIAKILIEAGAKIRCKDDDNGTPLQFAAAEGNLEIIKLIFNQCENDKNMKVRDMLDEQDNDGNTSLHLAVDNGHLHVTEYIIERCLASNYPAALNARRHNRETSLHLAARHGHIDIVQLLVKKGAKLNARDDGLQTPLMVAAQFNHYQVVEYLITCGANIELHDTDNFTALLIAANYGHTETIAILLQHKANVMAVDKNDKSVIFMCAEEDRVDALQEFLKRKKVKSLLEVTDRYDNTPLHASALNGNFAIVKILLDAGAVVDSKNEDEQTPLHLAAENGRVKIVKELISRKKEIVHDDDESANTPLHLAALAGREHCVRELVRLGASIGARNAKQWTPLDCCASMGMYKSALVLLEADSPVDPKDKRKITPLHLACKEGHRKMVELLLDWKADVTHRSVGGSNALDFAIDFGNVDCAQAVIDSDKWREALQNRTKDYLTEMHIHTPMRKLIRKMPNVAAEVFRKCLRDNGKHKDHPKYEISFDYEFLDDEFSCTNWFDVDDNTSEVNVSIHDAQHGNEVYGDYGKVLPDAQPYTSDSTLLMQNHPLIVMVKSKREKLMRHPLVISLLNHKWRSYGRAVYYTNLFIYIFFMAVLNSYMLTVPPPYAINQTETVPGCVKVRAEAQKIWGAQCPPHHAFWQPVAGFIVLVLAAIGLLKELYQMISTRSSYIRSGTNLIEVALYVLSLLLVIDVTDQTRSTGIREDWQWQCGSAALFFSWMGLLLFIQNFPRFGIFVLMFSDVFKTFISFFAVFVLFILGFGFSFHVLLQNQYAFDQWWNSIIKTFVMMIGEFEYDGIFNAQATSSAYAEQVQYDVITYLLFLTFMIIMSIIIMNLLVGLAVDDIKEVQENAVLESLAMQVKLALDIEYTLPRFLRRRFMKRYRKFLPNEHRKRHWFIRWLYSEEHLNHNSIEDALNPEKSELQNLDGKINVLQTKVRDLRGLVYDLHSRSRQVENVTQAIANHFKIDWEKNEDDDEAK